MSEKLQLNSLTHIISSAINQALSNTHTSTIAKVTKITGATISVKPVFKRVINDIDVELPEFAGVPIFTLQGGSNYRIMPIAAGDYALLIFSERCIDDWLVGGSDNKRPREFRMHDYSDAIAIVGLNNVANAINIPTGFEEVKGNIEHTGNYNLTGNIVHLGNNTQTGDLGITGDIDVTGKVDISLDMTAANVAATGALSGASITMEGTDGVSGTFNSRGRGIVTVTRGIITSIT